MTVLIREPQSMPPNLPVRVMPDAITLRDENGEGMVPLAPECDAGVAYKVSYEGSYVLVLGE